MRSDFSLSARSVFAKEILRMRESLDRILANHTGKSYETVRKDTERDFFMSGEQAKEYGIIDEVIVSRDEKKVKK